MSDLDDIDLEYKRTVEEHAKNRRDLEIPNSTLKHRLLVVSNLIKNTRRNLSIFTSSPIEIDYPEIRKGIENLARRLRMPETKIEKSINNLIRFFNKDKKIIEKELNLILCGEYPGDSTDFYNFAKDYADVIKIKKTQKTCESLFHFIISDGISLNLEEPHKREDLLKGNVRATANFYEPSRASLYQGIFDDMWERLK